MSYSSIVKEFELLKSKMFDTVEEHTVFEEKPADRIKELIPHFADDFVKIRVCKHCGKAFDRKFLEATVEEKHLLMSFYFCCDKIEEVFKPKIIDLLKKIKQYEKLKTASDELQSSGIGKRFMSKDFDNFVPTETNSTIFSKCKSYVEKFEELSEKGVGILLSGSSGVGKTHLAVSMLKGIAEKGKSVMFGSMVEIIQNLKASFDRKNETASETDIIEKLSEIDLLVIDDLGKENISQYVKMIAYQVINRRYTEMKPTIITTNDISEELIQKYDSATVSRILESSIVLAVKDSDYRRKISKDNQKLIGGNNE